MSFPEKEKLIRMLLVLFGIILVIGFVSQLHKKNSLSLSEYARQHPELQEEASGASGEPSGASGDRTTSSPAPEDPEQQSPLVGEALNGDLMISQRTSYREGFYYEPLSEQLNHYLTGGSEALSFDTAARDLRYVYIQYRDLAGMKQPGELICHVDIADDLVEIFYELYRNDYRLEQVCLVEDFKGEPSTALEGNNTFCLAMFNDTPGEPPAGQTQGLCVWINPLYNPLITYDEKGSQIITPKEALQYAERSLNFPYKIDEDDLCYKLFTSHGFTWGGNRNAGKAYGLFQYFTDSVK